MARNTLLYRTHMWSPDVAAQFEDLNNLNNVDCWLMIDGRAQVSAKLSQQFPKCVIVAPDALERTPYTTIPTGSIRGHAHFSVVEFFLEHGGYDYYWFVEYDVRYSGNWGHYFESFEAVICDLATAHCRTVRQEPDWFWWNTFGHPKDRISVENHIRSFNVIYRISNRALGFIHMAMLDGWFGHHEVLIPTLLFNSGFSLLDFGGDGPFTPPEYRNLFYTSASGRDGNLADNEGTIRYRPARQITGSLTNKLYHPVRPAASLFAVDPQFEATR